MRTMFPALWAVVEVLTMSVSIWYSAAHGDHAHRVLCALNVASLSNVTRVLTSAEMR